MTRLFVFFVRVFFLFVIAGAAGAGWLLKLAYAPGALTQPTNVVIAPGTGTMEIGRVLETAGVIASYPAYVLVVVTHGHQGAMKAGEYQFMPHQSLVSVVKKIARGDVFVRKVTVPEGKTVQEVIDIVAAADGLEGEVGVLPPEGRLLPETYTYTRGEKRQVVMGRMLTSMNKILGELWGKCAPHCPVDSPEAALTLASIVEKETGVAAERPMIASVFYNRLKAGMKLQSDPTVIYALTMGKGPLGRPLYTGDLEKTDSPYNTYMYAGLPPGPIANPGRASLEAVFNPADSKNYYFVANGQGGHVFAASLDEHNNNVARWRQIKAQEKKKAAEQPAAASSTTP